MAEIMGLHPDKIYQYPCLGYSYRNERGTPQFKIVQNLSKLPPEAVEAVEKSLNGETEVGDIAEIQSDMVPKMSVIYQGSLNIGATWTVLKIVENLGISEELNKVPDKYRKILLAMIIDRVINPKPYSKLELGKNYNSSALARIIGSSKECLHDWYDALEEIYNQQKEIEKSLFARSDSPKRMLLYDITSSYFEGTHCSIAAWGYNRDRKHGKKQIVIGLLTTSDGRPISIQVFKGNTNDQSTVLDQIRKVKNNFGLEEIIFIGDRGMITSARRDDLENEEFEKILYISALTHKEVLDLIEEPNHPLQLELFDRRDLAEIEVDGVRYILCYNPDKRVRDRQDRTSLLNKTAEKLEKLRINVQNGKYKNEKVIAKHLYHWLNRWKMGKFFHTFYIEGYFSYNLKHDEIQKNENIDGFYLLVTTVSRYEMNKEEIQKRYKSLSQVEQAFRTIKTSDLYLRPIRHWNPDRVRGHVFVCMLSYLIVWEARRIFSSFLNRDEKNNLCEAGSLRRIWKELDDISIGTIAIDSDSYEQISPLSRYQQRLLNAANALLDIDARRRINLVG